MMDMNKPEQRSLYFLSRWLLLQLLHNFFSSQLARLVRIEHIWLRQKLSARKGRVAKSKPKAV